MRFLKLFEDFQKNKWELLLSNPQKEIEGKRLIDLVNTAYGVTTMGSFVNTIQDVIKSNWLIIDYNQENGIDACIFYRESRPQENWQGKKIQGLGHDGQKDSKRIVISKLLDVLETEGNWTEVSDRMEEILYAKGARKVTDLKLIQQLFPNSEIKMITDSQYERTLENGNVVKETVFGYPVLKNKIRA